MKAIQVKYLPSTYSKPTRLKAFTAHHQITISVYGEQLDSNLDKSLELQIAELLADKLGWLYNAFLVGGVIKNGDHVFCIAEKN